MLKKTKKTVKSRLQELQKAADEARERVSKYTPEQRKQLEIRARKRITGQS